jgi:nucleoside-diphosphate-sugar epimerase
MTFSTTKKVLVVGATGATGKHVVQSLLDKGRWVVAVARSEEKMMSLLKQSSNTGDVHDSRLEIKELSISDLNKEQYQELTKDCDAIVWYVRDFP